jgi:hypothetical protein
VKKFYIAGSLVGTLVIAAAAYWFLWPAPRFLSLSSPNNTYRVEFRGDKTRPRFFFTEHSINFDVFQGGRRIIKNAYAHFGDGFDPSFEDEYPQQAWVNEQVLRLGNDLSAARSADNILVHNKSSYAIRYLRIKANDMFLIMDLQPGARLELTADHQSGQSWILCEGQFLQGPAIQPYGVDFALKNSPGGPLHYCISIENSGVKIASTENAGYTGGSSENPNIPRAQDCSKL